ncbi:hypothetical protein K461DRAFT_321738 [Myriangium duriaei CBS 260.36]|uniref:GPI anchored protein n=1 Tax=Myriangium duriaei CBS 260.36 TaxID=1168546 RepID=A0A9P4J3G9_9PEZI|nr:hypothetical protein K461DRAFT_321738 [Myriangium duriaei CBS 260.36]
MYTSTFLLAAFAVGAFAQNPSTTSLFLGVANTEEFLGINPTDFAYAVSVVGGNKDATTYKLDCTSGCPSNLEHTAIIGPSTFQAQTYVVTEGITASVRQDCKITSGTASCEGSLSVAVNTAGRSTSTSTVVTTTGIATAAALTQVVITGGFDQLSAAATATASPSGNVATHLSGPSFGPVGGFALPSLLGLAVGALAIIL